MPGIGRKTAQRLAFYILKAPPDQVARLAGALKEVKDKVKTCSVCFNLTEQDPCPICVNDQRNQSTICVVEEPNDIYPIENTREYNGTYHVLGGALSPLEGIGPDNLHIPELLTRIREHSILEIIIATNPNIEGEATAMYLARLLKPLGVKVTRIAHGLPVGSDLEYADEATMLHALEGRREMK